MIALSAHTRVYLALAPTDMRKSIDGLAALVEDVLALDPFSSHVFAFCNRARDKIKILYWHNNGFWCLYKRLEKQRFRWPGLGEPSAVQITLRELSWLLEGLEIEQVKAHRRVRFCVL